LYRLAGVETDFDIVVAATVVLEEATDVLQKSPFTSRTRPPTFRSGFVGAIREELLDIG